jgi:hypothetical protein
LTASIREEVVKVCGQLNLLAINMISNRAISLRVGIKADGAALTGRGLCETANVTSIATAATTSTAGGTTLGKLGVHLPSELDGFAIIGVCIIPVRHDGYRLW